MEPNEPNNTIQEAKLTSLQKRDVRKAQRWMELQRRLVEIQRRAAPETITESVLHDYKQLLSDLEALHASGPSTFALYSELDVIGCIARTLSYIADAYHSLGNTRDGLRYYQRAAQAYKRASRFEEALQQQIAVARVRFQTEGTFDQEYKRLQFAWDNLWQDIYNKLLDLAAASVEMGQLCSQANDDFEALQLLREAEGLLQWGNITAPTEADFETAARSTAQHFFTSEKIDEAYTWELLRQEARLRLAEQGVSNPSEEDVNTLILYIHREHLDSRESRFRPLETLVDVNNLYLNLYLALANALFEDHPEQAQNYLTRAEALHRMNLGNRAVQSILGSAQPNVTDAPAALDAIHARLELSK